MERQELESAARRYNSLRGLLLVPGGIIIFLSGLANLEAGPFASTWLFWVVAAIGAAAAIAIARYYRDHYGQVQASSRDKRNTAFAALIGIPVIVAGSTLDFKADLPINGTLTGWAVMMLVIAAFGSGLKAHHLLVWGAALAVALLPLWTDVTPDDRSVIAFLCAGVLCVVTGLLDHRLLVQSFGSANALAAEGTDVGA